MALSYPLCVFLESHKQQKLPIYHPFYCLIKETLQNFMQLESVAAQYMARHTFRYETQRVQDIIQYLQNLCLIVSGSNSPIMDSTFVNIRAYSGCGKDPKSKKIAQRKHIYIQKHLVDAWMKGYFNVERQYRKLPVLTFFLQLCLLHGLIAAVKVAFTSDSSSMKDMVQLPHSTSLEDSLCPFEYFLSQWNNGCLNFGQDVVLSINEPYKNVPYEHLHSIIFKAHFHYLIITYEGSTTQAAGRFLQQLIAGDWTATPKLILIPESCHSSNISHMPCLRMWHSPPTVRDSKPQRIEIILPYLI